MVGCWNIKARGGDSAKAEGGNRWKTGKHMGVVKQCETSHTLAVRADTERLVKQ